MKTDTSTKATQIVGRKKREKKGAARPRSCEPHLVAVVRRARAGDETALPELTEILRTNPNVWKHLGDLAKAAEAAWLQRAAGKNFAVRESIRLQLDALRTELLGATSTALQKLLAERVLAGWLEVYCGELECASPSAGSADAALSRKRLNIAHRDYLYSIKTLAVVRKLEARAVAPTDLAARIQRFERGGLRQRSARREASVFN